jgi:5-oxoprolinase (ATP-hydrolysing) subunit A
VQLATEGWVRSVSGRPVRIAADSICVHGDTPNAVEIARAVRAALESAGVAVGRVESPLRHTRQAV